MITCRTKESRLIRKLTAFILTVCMLFGVWGTTSFKDVFAAAPSQYTNITAGSSASVTISSSGTSKYFRFVPTASGTYKFYSTNYTGDPYGSLLDSNGNTLISDDDGGSDWNFSIQYNCTANTTYYIKAFMNGSSTGSYTLNVEQPVTGPINISAANGTSYSLFNSGRAIGSSYSYTNASAQINNSYNNNGYDLYGDQGSSRDTIQLGLSFLIEDATTELVQLNIYAYDVDEITNQSSHNERDYIYLVDETTGSQSQYFGYLTGQNSTWTNTRFSIDPSNFVVGHKYHFEMNMECTACSSHWVVYVRTVSMEYNSGVVPPPTPIEGIEYADLYATISSSGVVSACLEAKAYAQSAYTLEYKAVCLSNSAQYGYKEYSVTIPTTTTEFNTTFQLESGSPRGSYEITVFIKDAQGNVKATRSYTASYGYSAVSYNSNGGSQNLPTDANTYSSGDTVTVKFDYVPSLYGYTFLGWSTDRNATEPMYTENGTKTFTIGASDVTLYAVWVITECPHSFVETSRVEPTCTTDGKIVYSCTCGETKEEILLATGHNIESFVEVQVTCTTDGIIVDRCINPGCNYEKRTTIHGSHNYSITDRQEAQCEVPGYIEYTCSNCNDKRYEYFDGKHNYVESSRVEAQVGVDGSITYTCTNCNDSYSVVIPALTPVLKNSSVLLIQDSLPWAENVNTMLLETLKTRGVVSSYNIINTSALASFDLSQYGVVFIANDQSTAMYDRLAANSEKLESYVRAGGNLVYGACDEGWGGNGSLTHTLPGGVVTSNYYSVHNYIVNELHPIVTGVNTDNRSLKDELLKGNYCSHTYFDRQTLPAGTDIILRDANGNPTLVEYSLGDGTVIASGLTWEYFYVREHYNMITNYSKYAYDDLLTYMVYNSNSCEHDYQVEETVTATCEENGYTKYVCSICSHEYMGNIVMATGHNHVETSRTEVTCVANGEIVYTCACGDVYTEVILALGHDWEIVNQVAPTCDSYGSITYACDCGQSKTEVVQPMQHNYKITDTVEATCTADGYIEFTCQNAGCNAKKQQIIEKLGHYYGNDNVCDRCGHTIEVHSHDYTIIVVEPTCTTMGYTEYTCDCGYSYRDSLVEPTRHNWDNGQITIAKTCTSDGIMTFTCQTCSATKTNILPASHEWNEVVTIEKTCTTDGSKIKTCNVCGIEETEIIPASHNWNNGIVIVAATCTEEGSKLYACIDCGITEVFAIPALGHEYYNGVCKRCGEKFIDNVVDSEHPIYGMYFEIDDILSDYGPSLIDEYGVMLDYNSDANISKVAVFLTQDGTMWRRCIAVVGSNIQYATYVPYLSYRSDIKYTGLNHDWINIFRLSENADGVWCYNDYTTIGVNLEDAYGNLLLSLYDIGEAGAETRIFDDLDEMIAWLINCNHEESDWIVDVDPTCVAGSRYKKCNLCDKELSRETLDPIANHIASDWIVDLVPSATQTGYRHKECTVCHTVLESEVMPVLAKIVIENVEAKAGHTVKVTVDIQNNPGILGAILSLSYDQSLKLIDVETGSAWNTLNFTKPLTYTNPCNFVWDGVNGADYGNGTIIVLTFEIPANAAYGSVYNISASYTQGNLINGDLESIDIAIESGSVTVVNPIGDINKDGVLDVADVITLRRYLAGGYGITIDEEIADLNNDGIITISDVVLLRRALIN